MTNVPVGGSETWRARLTGCPAAAMVLAAFWLLMLASLRNKSATADEIGHAASGCSYWRYGDYRMNPENGLLPQRLMALPLLTDRYRFPDRTGDAWLQSDEWALGYQWFYAMGNNADAMLLRGRAVCGLLAVALGALVWLWARRLFGPWGGMLSLLLYVLSPPVLANGALMTSDMACSLFFLASTWSLWGILHRLSPGRVLLSALVMAGLFLSKMSAILMVPIALTLVLARLLDGRPLPAYWGRWRTLDRRSGQAAAFAAAATAHAAIIVAVVFGSYGFRYSIFSNSATGRDHLLHSWAYLLDKPGPFELFTRLGLSPDQEARAAEIMGVQNAGRPPGWTNAVLDALPAVRRSVLTPGQSARLDALMGAPPPAVGARIIDFVNRHRLLPEAYVYGYANAWKYSRHRAEFFNGKFGHFGWRSFFPYTFLVKTPLPVFGVMAIAVAAAWSSARRRQRGACAARIPVALYETLPLWILFGYYWALVIPSHLNIGNRHILPTYAPLFVLCGAAAWGRDAASRPRALRAVLCALVAALGAEVAYRFPNYIAYFNGIVDPARAYRHLVDSSLDWGQELPATRRYIEDHRLIGRAYLSYFGNGSPDYYKVRARYIHSNPGRDVPQAIQVFDRQSDARAERARHPVYDLIRSNLPAPDGRGAGDPVYVLLERPGALRLAGGTYLIGATMIQPVERLDSTSPFGPWNGRYEAAYQDLRQTAAPFLNPDPAVRLAALESRPVTEWAILLDRYETFRFARLTAYLRQREPDDTVNFSVLVYRLTDADIARALDGPPAELGEDVAASMDDP